MRIGIVNDMAMALESLRRNVSSTPGYEVAWLASSGDEAIRKCGEDTPDLILMDMVMPGMSGAEATRQIMQQTPCPILVVTASVKNNQALAFDALSAGAIDVVRLPTEINTDASDNQKFWKKIRNIGQLTGGGALIGNSLQSAIRVNGRSPLIAIGASTGGPRAVTSILSVLPEDLPAAVVVVMHVDQHFARGMGQWMDGLSKLPVRLVVEGEQPQPGQVLFAASNDHLVMREDQTLYYSPDPVDYPYRPSVDVFFSSIARHWHDNAIGVLLTGMGRDGARGLKAMHQHGWWTIAQDETSSAIYGMPKAAADIGAASRILALDKIGPELVRKCGYCRKEETI